jgi:hypothetical protein
MRVRLLATISCVLALFAAASFASAARSQTPVTTTVATTATSAATTVPTETTAAAAPAPAPAPTADAAQTEEALPDAGTDVPEVVVDFPDTEETAGDTSDDGELQVVKPEAKPDPTPAPVAAAPVAAAPVATAAPVEPVATPEPAAAPDDAPKDEPKDEPKADPTPVPLPEVAPTTPLVTPGAGTATPGGDGTDTPPSGDQRGVPAALKNLKPYKPAAHAEEIMAITAGGVATIGALAAGLGAAAGAAGAAGGGSGSRRSGSGTGARAATAMGGGSGGGSGDGGGDDGGWLEGVEIEREIGMLPGYGWGDRSRTWGWRTTPRVDSFSQTWPDRLARISPVASRVSLDGDYLRAMMGGLYLLLFPIAIGLGIWAATTTGGAALPPAFGLFMAILVLSIFDSMVGYAAGLAFAGTLLAGGYIDDSASVRLVAGLILVWFAVPLCASAVRPLRRKLNLGLTGVWDHLTDWVLAGLFAGWVAGNQISALGPLRGYELPIADQRWTVSLIVVGLIGVRILVETAATHLYPERLEAVEAQGEMEPPRLQETISLGIQMGVLAWISSSFMGLGWALWIGTFFFFLPLIPWLFIEKVPYNRFVAKWMPAGLAKWAFIIVTGVLLSRLLDAVITDETQSLNWGFILLPLPLLFCWALELLAENEEEEEDDEESEDEDEGRFPMTWPLRLTGVAVTGVCVYLVYFVIG